MIGCLTSDIEKYLVIIIWGIHNYRRSHMSLCWCQNASIISKDWNVWC